MVLYSCSWHLFIEGPWSIHAMLIMGRELFLLLKDRTKSLPFHECPSLLYAHREQRSPRQGAMTPDYMHQHLQARNLDGCQL
jgi:hypothetical protein